LQPQNGPILAYLEIEAPAPQSGMANSIRYWREKRGLSRPQLAEMVGCHWSQITKLERAERRLSQHWLEKIAAALQVEVADLLATPDPDTEVTGPERLEAIVEKALNFVLSEVDPKLPKSARLLLVGRALERVSDEIHSQSEQTARRGKK
jgi:transcriptional regulator with XRE-family HTH domain